MTLLMKIDRYFTKDKESIFDILSRVKWVVRDAVIKGKDGNTVFEQLNVEVPCFWSQTATNIVASKYFRGRLGTSLRERSVADLIVRVVNTISDWGVRDQYFDVENAKTFSAELAYILVNQMAAFNSPVWFNVGVEEHPQTSACLINSVEDSMESIMELAKTEGMIFKSGSGAGVNLSKIRGREEHLSGGGIASGPLSFMKGYDAFAGAIKSGGRTRRSAKICVLDVDHPDIEEFVVCKHVEEKKAKALIDSGYSDGMDGEAYSTVSYQNANNSVRVSDDFMTAVVNDSEWELKGRVDNSTNKVVRAKDLFNKICEIAHVCGDPGLQFDTTINRWNTCEGGGRINSSNPCSEFMFLDNSACNLASINLMEFKTEDNAFEIYKFIKVVEILITAQDILIDRSRYPTDEIVKNSIDYRPLGLGYANLGAYLMSSGIAYDSEVGRMVATCITALMTGVAYRKSSELAIAKGAFNNWENNKYSMRNIIECHMKKAKELNRRHFSHLIDSIDLEWSKCFTNAITNKHGFRNAQVTLLAPTGTISFLMDAVTTGVEPEMALLKQKTMVGGGTFEIVNPIVTDSLKSLGYSEHVIENILNDLKNEGTLAYSELKTDHLPVFDCAFSDTAGRCISVEGHIQMMAVIQPFLSGAISKTINMPSSCTVEDVHKAFLSAWKNRLKSICIYRYGSKISQPLNTANPKGQLISPEIVVDKEIVYEREKLPRSRNSITHKFDISGHEGYVTAGMYLDGRLGELFVTMAKGGSTVSGLVDAWATAISISLQYRVPYEVLASKFRRTRFEPAGFSDNQEIGPVTSVLDYLFKWLDLQFPDGIYSKTITTVNEKKIDDQVVPPVLNSRSIIYDSGPPCFDCGSIMQPNGSCYVCRVCGTTTGCG